MSKRRVYNTYETELLIACVDKYKKVIESKVTNAFINRDKQKAWEDLTEYFNQENSGREKCTTSQLQNLYRNLKKRAMKKVSDNRIEVFKTGGGPVIPEAVVKTNDELLNNMGVLRLPLPTAKDTNGVIEKTNGKF